MKKRDIIFLIIIAALLVTSVYMIAHSVANYKAGVLYREWQRDYMINAELAEIEKEKARQEMVIPTPTPTPTPTPELTDEQSFDTSMISNYVTYL